MFFLFGSSLLSKLKLYYSSAEIIKAGAALIRRDVSVVRAVNEGFLDDLSGSLSVRAAHLSVYEGLCSREGRGHL